jgi:recombinational DNA repair protein (RecF pathway)
MPTTTTEGIIIKRRNYGEADRILTVLTPYKGKISITAKGVRRITSRRAGNVEVLNKVRLHIFEGKGLSVLTEAESIETFSKIKSDLVLSSYGSHLIELIDRLIPDNQLNPNAYNLLATTLTLLEVNPRQIWIRSFEIKLLAELGFWSNNQIDASAEIKELLNKLLRSSWTEISEIKLTADQALELERTLRYYMERVLESPLRSVKVIEKLKTNI